MSKKNCYIWTRVSIKRQEDNGGSLDDQKTKCERYAKEHGFIICGYFGGTHESANTPGKLVRAMLDAVKKDKSVTHIIVNQIDRFSRNESQAVDIIDKLRHRGVIIVEVESGQDTSTRNGLFTLKMKLNLAEWDNGNRTDKFTSGRKHCMESGVYCGPAPLGYTKKGKSMGTTYIINEDGKLLAKAFRWKLQGMTNNQIIEKLKTYGLVLCSQKIHAILTNIFYTGKFRNKMLNYEVKDGNHPAIVSYTDFLKVQEILSKRTGTYHHKKDNPAFPLNRHVLCLSDERPLTHYTNKKKHIDYYKCTRKGCCTNISAKILHKKYAELLGTFGIPTALYDVVRQMIERLIDADSEDRVQRLAVLRKQRTECNNRLKKAKLRWATGENDDEDAYREALSLIQEQLDKVELEIEKCERNLSIHTEDIDVVFAMCCNLGSLWLSSPLELRRRLQNLLFPEGIYWDKEKRNYRTFSENAALDVIRKITESCRKEKEENSEENSSLVNLCA